MHPRVRLASLHWGSEVFREERYRCTSFPFPLSVLQNIKTALLCTPAAKKTVWFPCGKSMVPFRGEASLGEMIQWGNLPLQDYVLDWLGHRTEDRVSLDGWAASGRAGSWGPRLADRSFYWLSEQWPHLLEWLQRENDWNHKIRWHW